MGALDLQEVAHELEQSLGAADFVAALERHVKVFALDHALVLLVHRVLGVAILGFFNEVEVCRVFHRILTFGANFFFSFY